MNVNICIIGGRLTRDPELRFTPKGVAIANFGIATSRKFKKDDGSENEETLFLDVTAFQKQAELVGQHFKKGSPIFIKGRLKLDQWDDKTTGAKRTKISLLMEEFQFVGGKREEADPGAAPAPRTQPKPPTAPNPSGGEDDSEIPF